MKLETFILNKDIISTFESLDDIEAGKLIKHILRYVNNLNPDAPDKLTSILFEPIKSKFDKDLEKKTQYIEKQKYNGKLGGRPKKPKPFLEKPKKPKPFENEPKKPKPFLKETEETKDNTYPECVKIYNDFCLLRINCTAKIDGHQGKALKEIILYLSKNLKEQPATQQKICESFKIILDNFEKWDAFHQSQIKLNQINSNLINIINSIKNGTERRNSKGGATWKDVADISREISEKYPDM